MDVAERSRIIHCYHAHSRRFDTIAARRLRGAAIPLLPAAPAESPQPPTTRELEVLQLVADGFTNREIGKQLYVTVETVKSHVGHLLIKLPARNRADAVAAGLRRALIR